MISRDSLISTNLCLAKHITHFGPEMSLVEQGQLVRLGQDIQPRTRSPWFIPIQL